MNISIFLPAVLTAMRSTLLTLYLALESRGSALLVGLHQGIQSSHRRHESDLLKNNSCFLFTFLKVSSGAFENSWCVDEEA